jgi:hypothetical protein
MICISNDIPSGYNSSASDFVTAHNRAGRFLGLTMQALTTNRPIRPRIAMILKLKKMVGKRVAQAALRWVRVPARPELA